MIKKTITFKDFNNEEQTEDFWFNLSEAEVTRMEFEAVNNRTLGYNDMITKIAKDLNGKEMMAVVEDIIEKSYGERSVDGKKFHKTATLYHDFKSTGAYAKLFFELVTDADILADFLKEILPDNLEELSMNAKLKAETHNAAVSEEARRRSAARMQGFQQKAEKPVETVTTEAPVLVTKTAPPIFEEDAPAVLSLNANIANTPSARPDLWPEADESERAQFEAWKANQAQQAAQQ